MPSFLLIKECDVEDIFQGPFFERALLFDELCLMQVYNSKWIERIYSVCITDMHRAVGCHLF